MLKIEFSRCTMDAAEVGSTYSLTAKQTAVGTNSDNKVVC